MKHHNPVSDVHVNETCQTPAERDADSEIINIYNLLKKDPYLQILLDAMPLMVMVLNSKRQVVAVNQRMLDMTGVTLEAILGKRPGKIIGCVHSSEDSDGCGVGDSCRVCGAVKVLSQERLNNDSVSEECRILTLNGQALDWKVTATPMVMSGQTLKCLVIEDISDQKRRQVLERTFFHDILNTIGGIIGFSRVMAEDGQPCDELQEIIQMADELLEEVQSQRELVLAEQGELNLNFEAIEVRTFLNQMAERYHNHPVTDNRKIRVSISEDRTIVTDGRLLKRILGNMIKNALEASAETEVVTVFARLEADKTIIGVQNAAIMNEEVRLQIFKRSFSTKEGLGRGIGTYSMKFLGEQYLGGHVSFSSDLEDGTKFWISLPH